MQEKKTGQISSNTLSLRFMKNAAKAQQDREVDEAKTRVRNEEQWELSPELWKRESQAQVDNIVSYEQSYLPFLFPSPKTEIPIGEQEISIGGNNPGLYKGRRKFGKHEVEAQVSQPPPEPSQKDKEPRLHAISSHGRASASSSHLSQQLRPQQQHSSAVKLEPDSESASQVFLRPHVDAPKSQKRANNDSPGGGERKRKRRRKEQRPS